MIKIILKKIYDYYNNPWIYAKKIRRDRIIEIGLMLFVLGSTIMLFKQGEGSYIGLLIWCVIAEIILGIMIKFRNYNFIVEIKINGDDVHFELVYKTLNLSKKEINKVEYTLRYVYIYLKNGEKLYAHRKGCVPVVTIDGKEHKAIQLEDFVGVKLINNEQDTHFRT